MSNEQEPTTREMAIAELKICQGIDDGEVAHIKADGVLCRLLESLGYADVVEEFDEVTKWYG